MLRSVGRLFRVRLELEQRLGCLPRSSCSVMKPSEIFVVLAARRNSPMVQDWSVHDYFVNRRSHNRTMPIVRSRNMKEGTGSGYGGEERGRGPESMITSRRTLGTWYREALHERQAHLDLELPG